MNALKQLEAYLVKDPTDPASQVFERLIKALCLNERFDLTELYELNYDNFEFALNILKAWRLDRYTKTKQRLKEIYQLPAT